MGSEANKFFETPHFISPAQVKKIACIAEVELCTQHQDLAGLIQIGLTIGTLGAFERDTKDTLEII